MVPSMEYPSSSQSSFFSHLAAEMSLPEKNPQNLKSALNNDAILSTTGVTGVSIPVSDRSGVVSDSDEADE